MDARSQKDAQEINLMFGEDRNLKLEKAANEYPSPETYEEEPQEPESKEEDPPTEHKKVSLKVDGTEFEYDESAVIEAGGGDLEKGKAIIQREVAAQKRLDEAKAIYSQTQEYARQQAALLAEAQHKSSLAAQPVSSPQNQGAPVLDSTIADKLRFGDATEFQAALQG